MGCCVSLHFFSHEPTKQTRGASRHYICSVIFLKCVARGKNSHVLSEPIGPFRIFVFTHVEIPIRESCDSTIHNALFEYAFAARILSTRIEIIDFVARLEYDLVSQQHGTVSR